MVAVIENEWLKHWSQTRLMQQSATCLLIRVDASELQQQRFCSTTNAYSMLPASQFAETNQVDGLKRWNVIGAWAVQF